VTCEVGEKEEAEELWVRSSWEGVCIVMPMGGGENEVMLVGLRNSSFSSFFHFAVYRTFL
jgi:hypothetical protein